MEGNTARAVGTSYGRFGTGRRGLETAIRTPPRGRNGLPVRKRRSSHGTGKCPPARGEGFTAADAGPPDARHTPPACARSSLPDSQFGELAARRRGPAAVRRGARGAGCSTRPMRSLRRHGARCRAFGGVWGLIQIRCRPILLATTPATPLHVSAPRRVFYCR